MAIVQGIGVFHQNRRIERHGKRKKGIFSRSIESVKFTRRSNAAHQTFSGTVLQHLPSDRRGFATAHDKGRHDFTGRAFDKCIGFNAIERQSGYQCGKHAVMRCMSVNDLSSGLEQSVEHKGLLRRTETEDIPL